MAKQLRNKRRNRRGMTLVEIMVVLVILGLIAGAIAVAVVPRLEEARHDTAALDIQSIRSALKLYYMKKGTYPDTGAGLKALLDGQYIEKIKDPWGNDYVYVQEGRGEPTIMSYGRDGQPGGEGADADISSKDAQGAANK